tara:strand:- start:693 stop:944 length:252 start_codon:yes stop_codon:yes gene_type:complete
VKQFALRLRYNHKYIAIWDEPSTEAAEKRLEGIPHPDKFQLLEASRFTVDEWDAIVDFVVDNMPERNWKISRELWQNIVKMSQ